MLKRRRKTGLHDPLKIVRQGRDAKEVSSVEYKYLSNEHDHRQGNRVSVVTLFGSPAYSILLN